MREDMKSTFLIRMPFWGGLFALYSGKWKIAKNTLIPKEKIEVKPMAPPSNKIFFMDNTYEREKDKI